MNAHGDVSGRIADDGVVYDRHDLPVGTIKHAQRRVLDNSGYEIARMDKRGHVTNDRRERLGFIDKSGRVTDRHGYPMGYVPSDRRDTGMLLLLRGHGLDLP